MREKISRRKRKERRINGLKTEERMNQGKKRGATGTRKEKGDMGRRSPRALKLCLIQRKEK